jgi:hypothetical protein
VPILVKCITLKLLIYYIVVCRLTQTKRDGGMNSTEKGKRGEYFNNISEKCNLQIYYLS